MSSKWLLICLLGTILAGAQQQAQSLSGKQLGEVKVYVQQPSGEVLQVPHEYSARDYEHAGISPNANPSNTAEMLRLPEAKSTFRFKEGDAIGLWAELPQGTDPRRMELLKFETRGKQRVTYISGFGARSGAEHWNTVPFKARQNRDGKWLLEPAVQLQPGEYCFTPRSSTDHFCFGVDKK